MKNKENGIALITIIIVVLVALIGGGIIAAVVLNKNSQNQTVSKEKTITENTDTNKKEEKEDTKSNKKEEKIELEDQEMYAECNDSWKDLMSPQDRNIFLFTTKDEEPLVTIQPIFDTFHNQKRTPSASESEDSDNIAWTYYSRYETEEDDENYNQIYTWGGITKEMTMSIEKEIATFDAKDQKKEYIKGSLKHSDIKEKKINGMTVKYIHVQAKVEEDEEAEIYENKYVCYIGIVEPISKKDAAISIDIRQKTNNTDNFIDDSIIDEVVGRIELNDVELTK